MPNHSSLLQQTLSSKDLILTWALNSSTFILSFLVYPHTHLKKSFWTVSTCAISLWFAHHTSLLYIKLDFIIASNTTFLTGVLMFLFNLSKDNTQLVQSVSVAG